MAWRNLWFRLCVRRQSRFCRSSLSWATISSRDGWGVDSGAFLIWFLRDCILFWQLASAGSGEEWCDACALRGRLVSEEVILRISSPALCRIVTIMWFAASANSVFDRDLPLSFDRSRSMSDFLSWDRASTRFLNCSAMLHSFRREEWNWRRGARGSLSSLSIRLSPSSGPRGIERCR